MNRSAIAVAVVWGLLVGCVAAAVAGEERLQFSRDVRPILAEACYPCHGPDSAARQADLRLDLREVAIEMGAIVPEDPDSSEMIARIFAEDEFLIMPPPEAPRPLGPSQRETLRRWIAEGAEYQAHWSLLAPQRPKLPSVAQADWVRTPIDRFVLAELEARGLAPAPEADRRTLVRRVSLDLTGLPPTPEVVEQFLADAAPDAYERLVARLLESSQWGEHRGRYWLDYARYADTHGLHFDNYREMWSYRDWVIRAFNDNMPYDQFTLENLAGDLLPDATLQQQIASGFNRCNMTTNEGGIIDDEYRVLYMRDRTETTAQVWLGLTVNCAACHDHKFDPLTQREVYELSAFFNNTSQGVRDGNVKDTPPILAVPLEQDLPRWSALPEELAASRQQLQERQTAARPDFDRWLATATPETFTARVPSEALHLHVPLDEGDGSTVRVRLDGADSELPLSATASWSEGPAGKAAPQIGQGAVAEIPTAGDFASDEAFSCGAWVKLPANDSSGAIVARMDNQAGYRGWDLWVEGRRFGTHIVHQWSDDALKVVSQAQIPADQWTHVAFTYDGSRKAAGVQLFLDGQLQAANVQADSLRGSIRTDAPLKIGQRKTSDPLSGLALQDLRVYRRALPPQEVEALARAARYGRLIETLQAPESADAESPAGQQTAAQREELYAWWLAALDGEYPTLAAELQRLEREQADIRSRGTIAHVMQERDEPAMAHVLFRGEYDKRRDAVAADTPDVLPPLPADYPRNRLGLARWLMLPEHPLTARVTVNRFWQEVFGTGLVRTTGDFGVAGELPSHPELLDWLAVEFRESGWDVKRLFALIVSSAAYRQSATVTPEKLERDPDNRLLSRGPRFRMDAEMIRDHALAASGLLSPRIGGPSVKPYQPPGVWEAIAMNVSNTRSYQVDSGENLYRRSLYTFWKRMAPPASMEIFNAPNREFCVVRRERTNTPLQALVTLNDEQCIEAARQLATRVLRDAGGDMGERLRLLGLRLLARPFRPDELPVIQGSLARLSEHYAAHPEDAAQLLAVGQSPADPELEAVELAAWTMLCNQLMNLDEVLNK